MVLPDLEAHPGCHAFALGGAYILSHFNSLKSAYSTGQRMTVIIFSVLLA
jgi:hypothetical protein